MKKYIYLLILSIITLSSCDDTTDTLGMSISQATEHLTIQVSADEFNVASYSVPAGKVVSRSAKGFLGQLKDPETNTILTCNFMTQLRSMGKGIQFPSLDSIVVKNLDPSKPKYQQVVVDSCDLSVFFPSFYGDSLARIDIIAHELNTPYEESWTDNLYTDFDPFKKNMIRTDEGSIHQQLSFSVANHSYTSTSISASNYVPNVRISLNQPYTKDGVTYNNIGTYIMRKYYDPATENLFDNQYDFIHQILPGFYLETVGGLGCVGQIDLTQINFFFKAITDGAENVCNSYMPGTDEVLQKTNFTQDTQKLNNLINVDTCTFLKTPAAIYTELNIPVDEIMYAHADDTLSTARMFVPRINNESDSEYSFNTPSTILLIPTDSVEAFFKSRKLADSRTYFLATYDSKTNGYTFNNISDLIEHMAKDHSQYIADETAAINTWLETEDGLPVSKMSQKELADSIRKNPVIAQKVKKYFDRYQTQKKDDNVTLAHPSPFKLTLIPVDATYSTVAQVTTLTKVTPEMKLTSTRLMKGTGEYYDSEGKNIKSPITVNVIYSKFNN